MATDRLPLCSKATPRWFSAVVVALLIAGSVATATARPDPPFQSSNQSKTDYALIYGTVWGPDGRIVPGVPIKIRASSDKKPKWELVSDNRGEFAQRVPVGTRDYIVQADIKMPKGQPKPEATVHIEDNERKDVGLHLTAQQIPKK